jgi:hypothetical protein
MSDYPPQEDGAPPSIGAMVESAGRMGASTLGIVVIVIGLACVLEIFNGIAGTLKDPERIQPLVTQWAETLGGDELDLSFDKTQDYPVARVLAIALLGIGACVLAQLALTIMVYGAKIISFSSSDGRAVKKILQHAFGKSSAPRPRR